MRGRACRVQVREEQGPRFGEEPAANRCAKNRARDSGKGPPRTGADALDEHPVLGLGPQGLGCLKLIKSGVGKKEHLAQSCSTPCKGRRWGFGLRKKGVVLGRLGADPCAREIASPGPRRAQGVPFP